MKKTIKLTESQLINIIQTILKEDKFYSPLSKDQQINDKIKFEDKKELYFYISNNKMDNLKTKMKTIIDELIGEMGEENKSYITDFLKRMVKKMLMTYNTKKGYTSIS
jgi:hypothetical protein